MAKSKKQKAMDEEFMRECQGYRPRDNKPDGAYIEVDDYFFNINKIKRLIASGADVNAKDKDGITPLYWAVLRRNIDLAKLLIASGANVNAKNRYGSTPLHWAAQGYSIIEIAKLLIKAGADVDAKNEDGDTPLILALQSKTTPIATLLMESGAKVSLSSVLKITFPQIHDAMIEHKAIK